MSGARAEDGRIAAGRAGYRLHAHAGPVVAAEHAFRSFCVAHSHDFSASRAQFFPSPPPTFSDPLAAAGSGTRMGRGWDERMEALPYVHPRW